MDYEGSFSTIVLPGQLITKEIGYLKGHGVYVNESDDGQQQLVSSIAGRVERVNKLISVIPFKSRYVGEVGDLVVGRISSVESKRWKVDIGAYKDATLQLSSVNLPGGDQRIRTQEDQHQMRELYTENDLICAEIQKIGGDGTVALHTRSMKFGRLENGLIVSVPPALVRRLPQHNISLPWSVDLLLGVNGCIWISRTVPEEWSVHLTSPGGLVTAGGVMAEATPLVENVQRLKARHSQTPLLLEERKRVARTRNVILALSSRLLSVTPDSVSAVYQTSLDLGLDVKALLLPQSIDAITASLLK